MVTETYSMYPLLLHGQLWADGCFYEEIPYVCILFEGLEEICSAGPLSGPNLLSGLSEACTAVRTACAGFLKTIKLQFVRARFNLVTYGKTASVQFIRVGTVIGQ